MSLYRFESVELKNKYPVNIFITSIENSSFHWHYEYEIIIVLKGSINVNTTPKPMVMKENDIILFNPKNVHELKQTEEDNICLIVQLDQKVFKNTFEVNAIYNFYLNSVTNEIIPSIEYKHFIKNLTILGLKYLENNNENFYRINALIYTIVADLFQYVSYDICLSSNNTSDDVETLIQIIEYLQNNLTDNEILKSLYKDLGISEKTVYRFLKENIGMSAKELVTSMKIDKAKHLLKYTSKTVNYIIYECGFGSENSFYRIFRKNVGITPNEYRIKEVILEKNPQIKGYLDIEENETKNILKKFLEDNYEM